MPSGSRKKKGSKKKSKTEGEPPVPSEGTLRREDPAELPVEKLITRHTDEELFGKGLKSHLGECPLCCMNLPLYPDNHSVFICCSKTICDGCVLAAKSAGRGDTCPFCREPLRMTDSKMLKLIRARINAGDPEARDLLASFYGQGRFGLVKDETRAFEMRKEAAELRSINARYNLALYYENGIGVERDEEKALFHYEVAAMAGHSSARNNLGVKECNKGDMGRALKHFMIAAKMGDENSLTNIGRIFKCGGATKEEYQEALLGCRDALEEMKSDQRERARVHYRKQTERYYGR